MTGVNDILRRLEESRRLADIAEAARNRHGEHDECAECRRLDAEFGRAKAEVYLYELADARARGKAWSEGA